MKTRLITATALLALSGCVASTPRGVVAMKISDDQAHVCIRKQDVQVGDRVTLYKNVCTRNTGKPALSSCELKRTGTGTVTEKLNDHYSSVRLDKGLEVSEGDVVEVAK